MIEAIPINSRDFSTKERRIKKHVLVWCSEGKIAMEIDGLSFTIPSGHVITITSGQFHKFEEATSAKGIILQFTYDFFCKDDRDIELIFCNGLFCHFDKNEVIDVSRNPSIGNHMENIVNELLTKPYQYLTSIHSRIELILIEINRAKIQQGDEIWKPEALFLKFLESVRGNFQHSLPVKHYAEKLQTTELRLNELSKQHAGKTAQQIIHGLIVSEAKRLFYYERLSVKETAYTLGFKDPFYFSNFFKRHTDLSPQLFKEQVVK
ncbi:helix-turn-helix domain-containing protein [Flagellimonas meishanensis]|uniref:helix-turn-helix domain-containing protein n=1 Tax=Flagellimonas meishanensis TaxID=2873264 RepID=UPI001CA70AD8|nr:helix-turn-helix domain-containing protein [[Muricauda] meishanensis]